jgi:hypothetical protein
MAARHQLDILILIFTILFREKVFVFLIRNIKPTGDLRPAGGPLLSTSNESCGHSA